MSENKFIKRLKGEQTAKSVLEIKNESAKTSFANMPQGTSNAIDVFSDHRGNATAVLEGTNIWKLNTSQFAMVPNAFGDGRDFTSTYTVFGSSLWVNATYTFTQPKIFTGATQWTLKLCGHSLLSSLSSTIGFSLIIKFGNAVTITKSFSVTENAFEFCKEFIIEFSESEQNAIKVANGDIMTVQLLCADATASATIYNGMTTLVAQQRRVDGEAVASDLHTFEDLEVEVAQLREDLDDLEEYVDDTFVRLDGNSTMTGPLKMRATSSFQCAIAPFWDGVGFYKLNSDDSVTLIASIETPDGFVPWVTNTYNIGSSLKKWKNLYLAGKAFIATVNNGGDLAIPANTTGTLATKADVDLAANSGRMITDQGVWYAKMYGVTVAPAAENGTNYADFSQTDGQGNPIIVIYNRVNGAWVQDQTIIPPAEYDGYVPITSKIWDITEQAGQQGGRILWNHQSKEFTPYPQIISFENIEITGSSTVIMPPIPTNDAIVNKNYVDSAISSAVGNATITITQGGTTVGSFTTNQNSDETIALDSSGYYPDLFDWKWADHELDDMSWLRADTFSWQDGTVYSDAYDHLADDISGKTLQTETVGGTTISFYLADDGHKICPATQESNVTAIYTATGVAWYYILDTDNTRFKLPRTQHNVVGYRGSVGNYIVPGLPNITGVLGQGDCAAGTYNVSRSGAFYAVNQNSRSMMYDRLNVTNNYGDTGFDASRSNSIYGSSTTVQPPATQQYLYFYVGQFSQSAVEQTAGLNAELFNNKADVDIFNLLYPVGAVYIGIQSTCPLASIIPGSTWQQIQGRYLLASGTIAGTSESASAGAYVSAGAPNITGEITAWAATSNPTATGAFQIRDTFSGRGWDGTSNLGKFFNFNASRSSSVYGNSSTIRPAGYAVNVWVRTA